jgi:hypothetical protein
MADFKVDSAYAKETFPFLNLPPDSVAFHQPDNSGHLVTFQTIPNYIFKYFKVRVYIIAFVI